MSSETHQTPSEVITFEPQSWTELNSEVVSRGPREMELRNPGSIADASAEELEGLVKRIEAILEESYLGMCHAEIGRIAERAHQILASRQKRRGVS